MSKQFDKLLRKRMSSLSGRNMTRDASPRNPRTSDPTGDRNPKPRSFQRIDRCLECGGVGHRDVECPSRKNKSHKSYKVTWSDSESESSYDHDENVDFISSVMLDESFKDNDSDMTMHNKCVRLVSASKSMLAKIEALSNELSECKETKVGIHEKFLSRKSKWKA